MSTNANETTPRGDAPLRKIVENIKPKEKGGALKDRLECGHVVELRSGMVEKKPGKSRRCYADKCVAEAKAEAKKSPKPKAAPKERAPKTAKPKEKAAAKAPASSKSKSAGRKRPAIKERPNGNGNGKRPAAEPVAASA